MLQGAGDDFCVGEDLDEIAEAYRQDTEVQRWRLDDSWQRKYAGHAPSFGWPDPTKGLPGKPMLTVVHGKCHGSGLMFVVNSDFSIAADGAEFSLPNVHQGTAPVQEVLSLTNSMLRTPVLRLALLGNMSTGLQSVLVSSGFFFKLILRQQRSTQGVSS